LSCCSKARLHCGQTMAMAEFPVKVIRAPVEENTEPAKV
jgi:hypothetical protein